MGIADAEQVLAVVAEHEPVTVSDVLHHLGLDWRNRGTVRNRLYELADAGLIVCDDSLPMQFVINHLHDEATEATT